MNTAIVLLVCLAVCSALPAINTRGRKEENYDQVMLSPRILPDEMYGPNYVWDNKGMPRKIEEEESPSRQYYDAPPINVGPSLNKDFMPLGLENAMYLLKKSVAPENYKIRFPDSASNVATPRPTRKPQNDDIEQRMMLPEGMHIPDEMYGPNYVWDNKGWPSLVDPSAATVNYPTRNRVPQNRPVYFPGNDYRR